MEQTSHLLNESSSQLSSQQSVDESSETIDDEHRLLQMRMGGGTRRTVGTISEDDQIKNMLLAFVNEPKIHIELSKDFKLLDYWHFKRFESPQLYKLSQVVLSVPPTQVDVERMFSALVLVLTHLRNRLSRNVLDAIMLIKMNIDLVDQVDFFDF